ncbi:hypothetical protein MKL09_17525, partial [Methylobacterium sp. J-048]|uniref:hypothetical protein n=1 Tax=Methylobacterium sp. J-048 TaxID=2836635 RepID=UPI001FBA00C7
VAYAVCWQSRARGNVAGELMQWLGDALTDVETAANDEARRRCPTTAPAGCLRRHQGQDHRQAEVIFSGAAARNGPLSRTGEGTRARFGTAAAQIVSACCERARTAG